MAENSFANAADDRSTDVQAARLWLCVFLVTPGAAQYSCACWREVSAMSLQVWRQLLIVLLNG